MLRRPKEQLIWVWKYAAYLYPNLGKPQTGIFELGASWLQAYQLRAAQLLGKNLKVRKRLLVRVA